MKKVISIFKNKYFLTVIALSVWVMFFDKNDLKTQIELRKQVKHLTEERNYFAKEIQGTTSVINELYTNPKKYYERVEKTKTLKEYEKQIREKSVLLKKATKKSFDLQIPLDSAIKLDAMKLGGILK